jgi:hypothetical protein
MPVKKGEKKPEFTQEQRADIVERVCALYESQNATIKSCCDSIGISIASFNLWCAQFSEFGERYKKAKSAAGENFFQNVLIPKAMTATEMLLMEREIEEFKDEDIVHQGVKSKDDNGNPIRKNTVTRSKQQPNATTAIFIMKAAFPDKFKDVHEHTGKDGGAIQFASIPLETRIAALKLLEGENGE